MAPAGLLLRLPHEVLVNLLVRLELLTLCRLASTCRLLHCGQTSPQTPNPVEDTHRLRAGLRGWSRTLPVDPRVAIKYLLRLAWQDDLEFHSLSAGRYYPISFFVHSGGSLRSCGVELQTNEITEAFVTDHQGGPAGLLGFGSDWCVHSGSDCFRKEESTLVPATAGVRIRSVAIGFLHGLALTNEGQVHTWEATAQHSLDPHVPSVFEEARGIRMRRVSAGVLHSAAVTEEGQLYTWWENRLALAKEEAAGAAAAGYPPPELGIKSAFRRPRCVEALAGMRIVSVAAGDGFTVVATDAGRVFSFGRGFEGALGHQHAGPEVLPREIEALRGLDVATVSAGSWHVLALTYTGGVYSWGDVGRAYMAFGHEPGSGVIGTAWKLRQLPKRIEALRGVRVRCIAAGGMHSCAVTDEGHVYTWGSGHDGALGHTGFGGVWLPKRVEALHANGVFAVGVAAGAEHTLGAGADGAVWGFGSLNAIGAWNDPTLKAMLASHAENDAFYKLFASTFSDNLVRVACFDFLFLRRVSNISKPLRVTVNEFQDLKVLRH